MVPSKKKAVGIQVKIMNAVLCQGGLCTTKAGLDQLYKNGKAENLKDQIRYRKLVMGQEDLRLTGTAANLYQTLLGKICNEPSSKRGRFIRQKTIIQN